MTYIYNTPFRGSNGGSECAGSAARKVRAYNECPPNQPECDTVNFRGRGDYPYTAETKKSSGIFWTLAGAAIAIAGLGFAHKKGAVDKLKDGTFKNKIAEPVTNWCHETCAWTKKQGITVWEKIKGIFPKKGK